MTVTGVRLAVIWGAICRVSEKGRMPVRRNSDAAEGGRDDAGKTDRAPRGDGFLEGGTGAGFPDADLEGGGAAGRQGGDGAGAAAPESGGATGAEGHDARNGLEGGG